VPADGVVVEGTAEVDESLITGESRAIPKATGSAVVGGTVAAGGILRVSVRAIGEETTLSGIMRLVAAAQAAGSRAQALADRSAALLFYIAVGTGALTFAYWWMAGDRQHALIRSATVLVIACPHALGLAIPLAKNSVKRQKEFELRQALRDMRTVIDKYKDASDRGFIQMKVYTNGYPETLQVLVDGVQMVGAVDKKLKFLRSIPIDPMTNTKDWGLRSDQDDPKMNSWDGHDIFDVYTKSQGTAFDGTKYKDW